MADSKQRDITDNTSLVRYPSEGKNAFGDDVSIVTDELATRIDESSDTLIYIGYAQLGATENSNVWKIKRIQKTGNVWKVEFANGNQNYINNWTLRASLNYS